MIDNFFSTISELLSTVDGWSFATLAAIASAIFAGVQVWLTRRAEARRTGSGLSCHYYEQAKLLPNKFRPNEPGPWYDPDLVFRLDNVSNYPFVSVVATLELANDRRFSAYADWVAPNSTMYCIAGASDEHDFMFLDRARSVQMTYVDSSGKAWRRTSEGQLTRARHPFRRFIWWLWLHFPPLARRLPDRLRPRDILGKANLGATLHGVGDVHSAEALYADTDWQELKPSKQTIEDDTESIPQRVYEPTQDEWKLWRKKWF